MSEKPIPNHAKRVFKGVIFEVWQWEQKLFDGSTATFERIRRPDTSQVIPVVGDKILILEQQQPDSDGTYTSLAGGRCERGEDSLAAAKRELLEETGYESSSWKLWRSVAPYHKVIFTVYLYVAKNCRKVQEPELDEGEHITPRLVTFDDFLLLTEDPVFDAPELAKELLLARLHDAKRKELEKLLFD